MPTIGPLPVVGLSPRLPQALSERLDIIAVANDESAANALYVRADSPLLSIKGTNPAYPDIYGNQATIKGKEILCPKGTSAHYMMATWLKSFGLEEKDVAPSTCPRRKRLAHSQADLATLWHCGLL